MAILSSTHSLETIQTPKPLALARVAQDAQKSFAEDLADTESFVSPMAPSQSEPHRRAPLEKAHASSDKEPARFNAKNNKYYNGLNRRESAFSISDKTNPDGAEDAATDITLANERAVSIPSPKSVFAVDQDQFASKDENVTSETVSTPSESPDLNRPETTVLAPIPATSPDVNQPAMASNPQAIHASHSINPDANGQLTAIAAEKGDAPSEINAVSERQAISSARSRGPSDALKALGPLSETALNELDTDGVAEAKAGAGSVSSNIGTPQSIRLGFMAKAEKQPSEPDRADTSLTVAEPQAMQADVDSSAAITGANFSTNLPPVVVARDRASTLAPLASNLSAQSGSVPYGMLPIEIGISVLQGRRAIEVRLSPDELGTVEIKLEISDDTKIKAHIRADRPETLALMMSDAPLLRSALDQAGMTTGADSLQFSLKQDNGSSAGNGNSPNQRQNGQTPAQNQNEPYPSARSEDIPIPALRRVAGLLDVNI